jgi:CRISPR-associated protein Cmr1
MIKVKVTLETITPLWTGDAWMENSSFRPSSLIINLREIY